MQAVRLSCKKSAELRKIIAALKDAGGEHTPAAIASLTGLKPVNVRNLLRKMVACGDVSQPRVPAITRFHSRKLLDGCRLLSLELYNDSRFLR